MGTFWLKIAAFLVVIIAVIVGVLMIMPANEDKPKEPDKTFQQMVQKDKKIITAEPDAADLAPKEVNEQIAQVIEKPAEPVIFYFTELSEIEKIDAERLFSTVPSFKSIGRLPMLGYNTMVQACNQLITRYPGSIYDYKARRALAQIPKQYRQRYKITEQLINLSDFTKQRQNTYQYNPEEGN